MKNILSLLFYCTLVTGILASPASATDHWFTSIYAGQYSHNALNKIIRLNTRLETSYVYVVSVGKEVGRLNDCLGIELEGQAGGYSGTQNHGELNGVFTLRWLPFPWDKHLDTSFAFGNGLSYAFVDPELEMIESEEGQTSQWLYYILVELASQVPKLPQWELFIRIHHRSSVFGLINGVDAGSNFVGLGLRYQFNWG